MPQPYELNLRDYWTIFLKRKWIIMLCFFGIIGVTVVCTNFQTPLYQAAAMVKIEPIRGFSEVFRGQYYWREPQLADYAQQIRSRPIIEKAIKESNLLSRDASPQELDNLIRTVYGGLSTRSVKEASMIKITMVSQDPEKAAIILNKIVKVFKSENIKRKNQQAQNVREFIENELTKTSAELEESENKLKALTLKGIGRLAISITNKIAELESKRTDLLTKFTESYPDVTKIDEQLDSLREQLKGLPKEEFEFSNLERDVALNVRLYNVLRQRLQEAQIKEAEKIDNVVLISPAVAPRYPFKPNKPWNYTVGIGLGIIIGISVGLLSEHLDTSIGRIEDLENITKVSVIGVIPYYTGKAPDIAELFKKRRRIRSLFTRTVRKGDEAETKKFKRRKFGLGRKVRRSDLVKKLRSHIIITHKESSTFLEAFRILGANVQVIFGGGGRIKQKCILVTSSNPQEGKSIIAANLSIIMAQMGYKTVLIDGDLRRSVVHELFHVEKEKGITDVLTGQIPLESALRTTTDLLLGDIEQEDLLKHPWMDNFHLITSGTTFPNAPYLLNTEKMNIFLRDLKERFDIVIIDSSPILAVSDTFIMVPKTDGVLLVYRAGTTSRIALNRAKTQIKSAKGDFKGIILNNVTPEVSIDTYYYYYHRGKYYTQEKEGDERVG